MVQIDWTEYWNEPSPMTVMTGRSGDATHDRSGHVLGSHRFISPLDPRAGQRRRLHVRQPRLEQQHLPGLLTGGNDQRCLILESRQELAQQRQRDHQSWQQRAVIPSLISSRSDHIGHFGRSSGTPERCIGHECRADDSREEAQADFADRVALAEGLAAFLSGLQMKAILLLPVTTLTSKVPQDRTNSFTEINEPSQERSQKFSLRVDAELAVDRDEVISHGAGAEKHRPRNVRCTLTSNEPSHDLGLANR